ncbi:MAG TPA: helix-turn-helix domain-containing protein [Usitatibacter sp.]|nr:helix-turn-helix domain-containing protein [Usitatibacter sp.]
MFTRQHAGRKMREAQETVGQRVRRLREERRLSQKELAKRAGISFAFVSRIENGGRKPSLKTLRMLAPHLGVTADHLETGAPVPRDAERELQLSSAELELRLNRDLERAEQVFREEYERRDAPVLLARARAGLGLLANRPGDTDETIRHLRFAIGSGYLPPETSPDLYRDLGRAYVAANKPEKAVELFERTLADVRERIPDDAGLQVRFGVYLAAVYSDMGSNDRARRVLMEAGEIADEHTTSPPVRVSLYWGLASQAWDAADSDGALAYIRRAIGLLESSEDSYNLALAHLLAAQMTSLDGRYDEAGRNLERAERLFLLGADQSDLGILRAEQAIHAAALERAEEAMARATEAARLLGDDARHLALKWRALATAHRLAGDVDQADCYYGKALELLKERRMWRQGIVVAREWARLLYSVGREDEGFRVMEEATLLSVRSLGERMRARDAR